MRPTSTPTHAEPRPASVPPARGIERGGYLIIASPILTALGEFEATLEVLRVCDPHGASRHTLEYVVTQLRTAMTRSEELELWGSLDDVVAMTGRPRSTVTEWAGKYGAGTWCWKRSGVWAVDLTRFDAWLRANGTALEKRRRGGDPPADSEPAPRDYHRPTPGETAPSVAPRGDVAA